VLAALSLPFARVFNDVFTFEAGVWPSGLWPRSWLSDAYARTTGWQTMRLALVLMGSSTRVRPLFAYSALLDWLSYSRCSICSWPRSRFRHGHRGLGRSASRAERRRAGLQIARDQLEVKLKIDPLTDALTRHAFHSMPHGMKGW